MEETRVGIRVWGFRWALQRYGGGLGSHEHTSHADLGNVFACSHTVTVHFCALHGQESIYFHQGLRDERCWMWVEGKDWVMYINTLGYITNWVCWERKRGVGELIKGVPSGHSSWQNMPWPPSLGTPSPLHPDLLAVKRAFPVTVSGSLLVATTFFQTAIEDFSETALVPASQWGVVFKAN